jgi:hypothetical protein
MSRIVPISFNSHLPLEEVPLYQARLPRESRIMISRS